MLHNTLDANESIFFARELENIKSRSFDVKFPELKIAEGLIIPISREADPADTTITYIQFDQQGIAKIISNYADDLPAADVSGKEFTSKIKSVGASYGYNLQEIRASRKTGKSLDQRRSNAARRSVMQKFEQIGFSGEEECGLQGFVNHPNIQEFTLPNDGAGSSTTFESKTIDQILRDLNGMATQINVVTKGIESPDTLLLPLSTFNFLATLRLPETDNTLLNFFVSTSPHINNVEWLNQLEDAGSGGEKVAMMYTRDPDKLTFEIPVEYEQLAPQQKNLAFMVPAHGRTGGVIVYYPLSIIKAEGV